MEKVYQLTRNNSVMFTGCRYECELCLARVQNVSLDWETKKLEYNITIISHV